MPWPGCSPGSGGRRVVQAGASTAQRLPYARGNEVAARPPRHPRPSSPRSPAGWRPASPPSSTPSAARWLVVDPDLAEPLAALRGLLLAGGKRLRPVFCHWAFVGVGGDPDDQRIVDAGAALELLHTMAVIHDDIMDGSVRRHGTDTLHHDFARRHRRGGWRGEDRRFGEGVAILMGDLAFVYSDQLMADAPKEAWEVFNRAAPRGQRRPVPRPAGHGPPRRQSRALARRICRFKSGKYTVERPLHLGAALGAPGRLAAAGRPAVGVRAAARRGVPAHGTTCWARSATPRVTGNASSAPSLHWRGWPYQAARLLALTERSHLLCGRFEVEINRRHEHLLQQAGVRWPGAREQPCCDTAPS